MRTFLSLDSPHPLAHSGSHLAKFIVKIRFPRTYSTFGSLPQNFVDFLLSFFFFFVSCECRLKTILVSAISMSDHLFFFSFESEAVIKITQEDARQVIGRNSYFTWINGPPPFSVFTNLLCSEGRSHRAISKLTLKRTGGIEVFSEGRVSSERRKQRSGLSCCIF